MEVRKTFVRSTMHVLPLTDVSYLVLDKPDYLQMEIHFSNMVPMHPMLTAAAGIYFYIVHVINL